MRHFFSSLQFCVSLTREQDKQKSFTLQAHRYLILLLLFD